MLRRDPNLSYRLQNSSLSNVVDIPIPSTLTIAGLKAKSKLTSTHQAKRKHCGKRREEEATNGVRVQEKERGRRKESTD
uniref:Uncharacterized protein n=1 Tax=Cannabis sativa TaxID=3483 RepID=A0A803R1K8_CANSA